MAIETHGKSVRNLAASILPRVRAGLSFAHAHASKAYDVYAVCHGRVAKVVAPYLTPVGRVLRETMFMRFISKTLLRRIIASNLTGLVILLMGLTYLIQFNSWLIDAKIEHLRAQSNILAAAIASKASLNDPVSPGGDPLRDNPFAAIEFSIQPDIVVPLLPSLLEKATERGRVYDVSGVLIADSARIMRPGSIIPIRRNEKIRGPTPKTKNIWTRLTQWLMNSDLRVYKEIGTANGRFYPEVKAALEGKPTALMMLANRQKIVSVATPIIRGDEVRGALLLSTQPGAIDAVQANELFAVMVLILIATAAALLASYLLTRTVAVPVQQLSQYANEVTKDIQAAKDLPRFDERADEVGQLARSFSMMTRALYRRIEASEKFAADVAHELKNPLTAARSTAESLIYVKTDQQRDEFIEQIQLELKRLNQLISDVADASRLDAELALQRFEPVHLPATVTKLVDTFRDLASGENKKVNLIIEPAPPDAPYVISGQDGRIEQVLTNIISNALSFTPDGGEVTVRLRRHPRAIDLIVEDQGTGIDPENIEKIFTRFYTYRPTANTSRGNNSGLGLAISKEIVTAHDGRIWAENIWPDGGGEKSARKDAKPLGARFIVRLPAERTSSGAKRGRLGGGR